MQSALSELQMRSQHTKYRYFVPPSYLEMFFPRGPICWIRLLNPLSQAWRVPGIPPTCPPETQEASSGPEATREPCWSMVASCTNTVLSQSLGEPIRALSLQCGGSEPPTKPILALLKMTTGCQVHSSSSTPASSYLSLLNTDRDTLPHMELTCHRSAGIFP